MVPKVDFSSLGLLQVATMSHTAKKHGLSNLTPKLPPSESVVDIVFVHGLNGDKEATWTKNNVLWPRDLLPKQKGLEKARILTWGYDSHIAHFWGKANVNAIDDHASNLCADLSGLRKETNTTNHPIIFVAHSLGGLVCTDALVLGQNHADEHVNEVTKLTRGVLFLGTPHGGSDKTKWAALGEQVVRLFKSTNPENFKILEEDSVKLDDIGKAFQMQLRKRDEDPATKVEIACFFEEFPTNYGVIVTKASASFGSYETLSIPEDHIDMCKFNNSEHPGYNRVKDVLVRWVSSFGAGRASQPGVDTRNNATLNGDSFGVFVGQGTASGNSFTNHFERRN